MITERQTLKVLDLCVSDCTSVCLSVLCILPKYLIGNHKPCMWLKNHESHCEHEQPWAASREARWCLLSLPPTWNSGSFFMAIRDNSCRWPQSIWWRAVLSWAGMILTDCWFVIHTPFADGSCSPANELLQIEESTHFGAPQRSLPWKLKGGTKTDVCLDIDLLCNMESERGSVKKCWTLVPDACSSCLVSQTPTDFQKFFNSLSGS